MVCQPQQLTDHVVRLALARPEQTLFVSRGNRVLLDVLKDMCPPAGPHGRAVAAGWVHTKPEPVAGLSYRWMSPSVYRQISAILTEAEGMPGLSLYSYVTGGPDPQTRTSDLRAPPTGHGPSRSHGDVHTGDGHPFGCTGRMVAP